MIDELVAQFFLALIKFERAIELNRLAMLSLACFSTPMAIGLLVLLRQERHRKQMTRPDWGQMMQDTEYFKQAVWRILRARGYEIQWAKVMTDPIERQPREVVFALKHRGVLIAALAGRWVIPITSEVITRFQQALDTTQARRGMILTTSHFTDAAKLAAVGQPVELHDGDELSEWMQAIWG